MAQSRPPATPPSPVSMHQLRVTILGIKPPVWRAVLVPSTARLDWLHAVLQTALGWTNSHLHQFQVGINYYSDVSDPFGDSSSDSDVLDETAVTLMEIAPEEGFRFRYEYDFGDSWDHEITVEKILAPDLDAPASARCLAGARACPPEDCGGVGGYHELLRILGKPSHKEYASMREWIGRDFDAEAFDVAAADKWVRKLKFPRVSEAALRKVLMARDGAA